MAGPNSFLSTPTEGASNWATQNFQQAIIHGPILITPLTAVEHQPDPPLSVTSRPVSFSAPQPSQPLVPESSVNHPPRLAPNQSNCPFHREGAMAAIERHFFEEHEYWKKERHKYFQMIRDFSSQGCRSTERKYMIIEALSPLVMTSIIV